jgi:hypothetical protein
MFWKHIGKKWTLEYELPTRNRKASVFITDAISAATLEIRLSKNLTGVWTSNLRLYNNVPPYLRNMIYRKLCVLHKGIYKMKKNEIIIVVEGGVIQDIQFPENCPCTIQVRDYDIEGTDEDVLTEDEDGNEYVESNYSPFDGTDLPENCVN